MKSINITVRTWHSTRDESHPDGWCKKMFLETVPLPVEAVERIQQWAKDNQVALLDKTHKSQEMSFIETQRQSWLVASNKLFKQLQREGLTSKLELLAIGFLFTQYRDNPELINLAVTKEYFAKLEKEKVA